MDLDKEIGIQKLILLKQLEMEPVSEIALEFMERLAEDGFVSDAMRKAYCMVAVDCTLRVVKLRPDASGREFFEVFKRLWRGRVGRVVKSEETGGLGSELLREWKDMIETALWDDSVCDSVLKKFEGVSAVEAVKVYVREEWAKMGASFPELVAEAVKTDQGLQKIMGVDGTPSRRADQTASGNCADPRADQAGSDLRASGSRAGQAASGSGSRSRADMADMAASGSNPSKEMPKPERIHNMKTRPKPERIHNMKTRPKPERIHNMKKRRPARKWSLREEVDLWRAVKECGVGKWKLNLTTYQDKFLGRTQVDLKDKWRNITR